jgi:Na+-driven multidrug efflux pump
MVSGIINVLFNLCFVIVFHMGVAGVALATIISEGISAGLILSCLKHMDGPLHFELKDMRFHKELALKMLEVGLPAGLQGIIFSIIRHHFFLCYRNKLLSYLQHTRTSSNKENI